MKLNYTIFSRLIFVLWNLIVYVFDMHLDMVIPYDLIYLNSSMLGRRNDLIMEMLIINKELGRC